MLSTLNLFSAVCQLYLNKTGREKNNGMAHTNPRLPFPAACCPVNSWLPQPFHFMFHSFRQNMNASCVITRAVVSPNQPDTQVQRGF